MFSLMVYAPLPGGGHNSPTAILDLDPDITSLRWSTALPGGYADLEVGLRRPAGPGWIYTGKASPIDIVPFAHVELWRGSFLCFEGRVMRIVRPGGDVRGFSAIGYGITALSDDFYRATDNTAKTSGFIVREAISQRAPLLSIGPNFGDPGVVHARGEFDAYTPADLLNVVVSEGGVTQTVWDYYVYEGRQINLIPRVAPAGPPSAPPDYAIPFDERVEWSEDYSKLYGTAAVRFTDLDGKGAANITGRYTDPTFLGRYGVARAISVEGGQLRSASARNFARNYVAVRSIPAYAVQITRERLRGMEVPGGAEAPPWIVRAGQWVGVGDQPYQPIIHTEYDASSQRLVVEAGDPLPTGSQLVRTLTRLGGNVVRGTNPSTGARR